MKVIVLVVNIVLLYSFLQAQEKKVSLAILDFNVVSGLSEAESVTLTNTFRSELFKTGRYDVLERNEMESILREQAFTLSGNCNSTECAVEIGQLLSAEKIVIGDIGKIGETFALTIRLVNVSTSQLELSLDEHYQGDPEALLDIIKDMAHKLAGVYDEGTSVWWYVGGVAIVSAGVAAVIMMGGEDQSTPASTKIGEPPNGPQVP